MNIYDIVVKDIKNEDVSLKKYEGKIVLIVNTATGCGFTPQYKPLQELYDKYKEKDFEILDFPCNQFGNQASGSNEEIKLFCEGRFGITFPQFAKIEVNGKNESELFKFLKSKKGSIFGRDIKWNFTKFLVDRKGNVIKRFSPTTSISKIEDEIKKLLNN